ncbi:tetratricopeptide repeat protein [Acinetobacter sp. YH16052]|uniref:YfgM family protein n=1 Tax=Acinetobacter sp. YH16052 TaxID=2601191 RepID=UPI0015D11070|nr:tetratricopeptide repeat protein [Acinetobacter sp. YH16052]
MSAMSGDEQFESLKSFTKKYGSSMITGILIALIAFFGWEYWQKKNLAESQMHTAKVQQLMDDAQASKGDGFAKLSETADKIVKEAPDSAQAIQTQLVMAKLAYDKEDYAAAEKALQKVENSKVDDKGLVQVVKLRMAYAQLAQKKYDAALKTLEAVTEAAFKATADEARGDIYVAKNDIENAKKVYQSAWDALIERKEERQILQIKLESVGVLVDDPEIERPIIETQAEEAA